MLNWGSAASGQIEWNRLCQFCLQSWADFEYFDVLRSHKIIVLINFHLFCWWFRTSRKTCLGHLRGRAGAKSEDCSPQGLERKKWSYGVKCDSHWGFKAKVREVRERLQEGERWHVEGARQSRENITRIAPSGPFRKVEYVWILIPAWLLKVKLDLA